MEILQNKGVQMVLTNLIKAAAPDLVKTVDEIAEVVRQFKAQNDRIEALLLKHLGETDGAQRQFAGSSPDGKSGSNEKPDAINSGSPNGAGKPSGE